MRSAAKPTWRRVVTPIAAAAYLGGVVAMFTVKGFPVYRDWIAVWLVLGLLVLSLNDVGRWLRGVLFDWLPFIGILVVYDFLRGTIGQHVAHPHFLPQIDVDRFLFGTPIPTVWLQQHLYHRPPSAWYDYAVFGVYLTHFLATLVIAAVLWRFAYASFRRFRTMVVALFAAGFATYALFPAAPPWMAGRQGYIPHVHRIVAATWHRTGIHAAEGLFERGSAFVNKVAAVPSLHAAFPVLFVLFFWRTGWLARVVFSLYALAMAFTLVYTGEHYVSDVLLGWVYAVVVYATVVAGERAWARLRARTASGSAAPSSAPATARSGYRPEPGPADAR